MTTWRPVPVTVTTDLAHGGRWTSLRGGGREWLWTNPDPGVQIARAVARPGDPFVDAGAGEECFPTVQGAPDHGDLWSRAWDAGTLGDSVAAGAGRLVRRITEEDLGVRVTYRIVGRPALRFVHALHLLVDVSPAARIELPGRPAVTWRDADGPGRHLPGRWPSLRGTDFSRLGPDDGTAACLVAHGVTACRVVDGGHALTVAWRRTGGAGAGESLVLWRNLRGWPSGHPYRSIGVEPCLGDTVNHDESDLCSATDAHGEASWHLVIEAFRTEGASD